MLIVFPRSLGVQPIVLAVPSNNEKNCPISIAAIRGGLEALLRRRGFPVD